ncbi:hypothetical protein FXV77_07045 [Sphingobacterium phlebotomi]|uniref:Uncharacterized protein n=1 Tax=Sphingobacterium phlebotomi TaxID=2605433 RepID=A0A5D4H8C2_9SPHI|nr:hypothetical protein [Sphingobacterium phlebotomi]TYR36928.1 hypothetical protein FXV77_07045 [Sphingobacterium phlebotomi]
MSRYILIWCLVALVLSCRSYRERTKQEATRIRLTDASSGIRYGFQLLGKDSLERSWSFVTDSVLFFHPEYGLISNGGHLHFLESQLGLQQWQVEVDSREKQRTEIATQIQEQESRTRYSTPWWIWGLGGLSIVAILLYLRVYRRGQR